MSVDPGPPADPHAGALSVGMRIDVADAMELVQMLTFLGEWLDSGDGPILNASLQQFAHDANDIADLRTDLARFAFLLGGGDRLVGPDRP